MTILEKQKYEPLTVESAAQLVKELKLFKETACLEVREIGDGNLNYVFKITDAEKGRGVIIKQALPYAKVVGESWPLTLKRSTIEANALKKHGEYVPHLVPKVFATDENLAITIMEDLSHLTIARSGLINGEDYPKLSSDIGEYLARTLFSTSDFALHPFEKKRLAVKFSNPELCKITEDLIFTDPFFDHETNNYEPELRTDLEGIWNNKPLKLEVARLKRSFLTEAEALLHGDLHTGSIFASDTETKVIDPEFAFYGPIGFDVGLFIGNLIFQVIVREGNKREVIKTHIENTWNVFASVFSELWDKNNVEPFAEVEGYQKQFLQKVFSDALGFAGCELIRRTVGLAHVKDLDGIQDNEKRITSKRHALAIGTALILQRREFKSIKEAITLLEEKLR
ncbi:5'-methylthioribose kinase [Bacillus oleivorans]|uniref:Methylthioribose kinase n=1 Tax=Bacillus oleivorans TaxID=1448271 RepID=A0A285CTE3_9BACI|nr:S-methyl-5-thioribose kinase [Bacillus oleivorans]SNX70850.1 5'-methylthioribose kinase [Bacillus oleivorans]